MAARAGRHGPVLQNSRWWPAPFRGVAHPVPDFSINGPIEHAPFWHFPSCLCNSHDLANQRDCGERPMQKRQCIVSEPAGTTPWYHVIKKFKVFLFLALQSLVIWAHWNFFHRTSSGHWAKMVSCPIGNPVSSSYNTSIAIVLQQEPGSGGWQQATGGYLDWE